MSHLPTEPVPRRPEQRTARGDTHACVAALPDDTDATYAAYANTTHARVADLRGLGAEAAEPHRHARVTSGEGRPRFTVREPATAVRLRRPLPGDLVAPARVLAAALDRPGTAPITVPEEIP